ncbi:hypothetical protein ACFL41_02530 [Gemmatimonadota bacterium]
MSALVLCSACSRTSDERDSREPYEAIELEGRWLFDPESPELEEWQILVEPRGIELTPYDDLIIADGDGSRLVRITPDGELVEVIGRRGEGPGEFQKPYDVSFCPGTDVLWVFDSESTRISRMRVSEHSTIYLDSFNVSPMITFAASTTNYAVVDEHSFLCAELRSEARMAHIDDNGETLSSFGDLFTIDRYNPDLKRMYNFGTMLPGEDRIWFIGQSDPLIEVYSKDYLLTDSRRIMTPEVETRDALEIGPMSTLTYFMTAVLSRDGESIFTWMMTDYDSLTACVYEIDLNSLSVVKCYRIRRVTREMAADDDGISFYWTNWLDGVEMAR